MQIKLLGTAAAEGVPAIFCACESCVEAKKRGGKDIRSRSGALIDTTLKIDLSPDTLYHIHKHQLNPLKWKYLIFTHSHDDHFAPYELQYLFPPFPKEAKPKLKIFGSSTIIDKIKKALPEINDLDLNILEPFKIYEIGDYEVTPILANHKEEEQCLNLIIHDGEMSVLYATDTGWYEEETWKFIENKNIDAAIIECTTAFIPSVWNGHLDIPNLIKFKNNLLNIKAVKPDAQIIATHFAHEGKPLHDDMCRTLAPENIISAYDGLIIEL